GKWYSRALQAFTTHYFRITCGASQATGTFLTANIALGNTYKETLPADPAVGARPYFSSTGSYAWPEFLNWNNLDPAARPESVIDPQTGMLLKRVALPQDQPITYLPGGGDHYFYSVLDPDRAWNLPTVIWSIANGGLISIVTGTGTATVTTWTAHQLKTGSIVALSGLTGSASAGNGLYAVSGVSSSTAFQIGLGALPASTTLGDLTLAVKGWCSGTCTGEDAKIQGCLTVNGVTCWPTNATAKYQEVALGTSVTNTFTTLGTTVPLLDAWTPAGLSPLNRADLS